MIRVSVKERGNVPRKLRKAYTAASKVSWEGVGRYFHTELRDKRFTEKHAAAAGYTRRKGELMSAGSKAWKASYTGRKFAMWGHTRPLEFSGATRRKARSARITTTSKGARVAYSGLNTLNFRHPKSQIRMSDEFRRILQPEANDMARLYDRDLDAALADMDR